jgi:hypothetical protein
MDMKRKRIFKFLPLLLLVAGAMFVASCSSDDEDEVFVDSALKPLLGYWQYTGTTYDSTVGVLFKADGEVMKWEVFQGEYHERHLGTYGMDEDQHYFIKDDSRESSGEDVCHYITESSSDFMTIHYSGWSESLEYQSYKKLPGHP